MLLGHRVADGTVKDRDRLVAMALQVYEDSLCAGCGQPHWKTHDERRDMDRFTVKESRCFGCETLTTARDEAQKRYNDGLPPGFEQYMVDTLDPAYQPA